MELIPDKRKLSALVEAAHDGKLCLPNFQRDFVWSRDEVAELLRSVLRRYYIGSLLLLRCDPQNPPFSPLRLRGSKAGGDPRPELLILDGQQRMTSLLYALTAPDLSLKDSKRRRWFFVNLDLLINEPESDEIVFDRAKHELDGLDEIENQYQGRILPCERLLRSKDFLNWRDGYDDWSRKNDPTAHTEFRDKWRDEWTSYVTDFQSFEVPLVELPTVRDDDDDAIGRVCAIFEKLNSTGVELSVYDLLTARLYRAGIRLHDLWASAIESNRRLSEWSGGRADRHKFGVMVLRTLALLRNLDPKPSHLINLSPVDFVRDWQVAAGAIERALELLEHVGPDGFGVFNKKWLPGFGMVPVLAALRHVIDRDHLPNTARADLRRWYWCNVFLERYSSAVESKSRKDYSELLAHWKEGAGGPAVFLEAQARIGAEGYSIRDSASYASALYSGMFCLLAIRGARDWKFGESIELQTLEDHHIFPKAYLRARGVTRNADVNSLVNRTLLSEKTNGLIRDKAPADYMANKQVFPSGPTSALLSPHFVGQSGLEVLLRADATSNVDETKRLYSEFQSAREAEMVAAIREVCHVAVSQS